MKEEELLPAPMPGSIVTFLHLDRMWKDDRFRDDPMCFLIPSNPCLVLAVLVRTNAVHLLLQQYGRIGWLWVRYNNHPIVWPVK